MGKSALKRALLKKERKKYTYGDLISNSRLLRALANPQQSCLSRLHSGLQTFCTTSCCCNTTVASGNKGNKGRKEGVEKKQLSDIYSQMVTGDLRRTSNERWGEIGERWAR